MTGPEATIYAKHPVADDTYYIGGAWAPACVTAVEKRFTDAEMAAEFWRISWAAERDPLEFEEQMEVLYRFATLPHYDKDETA